MMKRVASLGMLAAALTLSFAADAGSYTPGTIQGAKPMFVNPPRWPAIEYKKGEEPTAQLSQWNGSFTDLTNKTITYTMVGADPSTSNAATHVTTYVIPVIMVYGSTNGNMTFDPTKAKVNKKKNVIANLVASPIFDDGYDFKSGGQDLGQGQYIDEYQRGNFWSHVSTNTGYHTILDYTKAKKLKPLTITVASTQGQVMNNPFGAGVVGTMTQGAFDAALHTYITKNAKIITPGVFPLFISYDIYLTAGGCCIGGYHNALGRQPAGQTYGYSTYVDSPGAFSEDIDAISHEVGEWTDDPFVDNRVNCQDNNIMENGDPLENNVNYGTFQVKLNKFTYHPQSLVYIGYFGAPRSTEVDSWLAFENDKSTVCPGQ